VVPPLQSLHAPVRLFALGRARWPALLLTVAVLGLLAGVPLVSLLRKTGTVRQGADWSATLTAQRVLSTLRRESDLVGKSLFTAAVTGAVVAGLALVLCWLLLDAPRWRRCVFVLLALAWCLPGPIVGIGLKQAIVTLVAWWPWPPFVAALYEGFGPLGSPVPVIWAHTLRFLPCAVAILWPVVRALPVELRDDLHLDGPLPSQALRQLVWPLTWRAWSAAAIVIAAQSVCEIGAIAGGVETPGWKMFAHELFNRMHYGQASDVSALCLLLLFWLVVAGVASVSLIWSWHRLTALRRARRAGQ
jgi:ABC-type Fe3+ transport system permease subunit